MSIVVYICAALAEIAGYFVFWTWLRLDKSPWWLLPGVASLCLFAFLLTLVEAEHAGSTYAAYGGILHPIRSGLDVACRGSEAGPMGPNGSHSLSRGSLIILWGPRPRLMWLFTEIACTNAGRLSGQT